MENKALRDQRPDEVYLAEVQKSPICVGLFGNEYGWQDDTGLSPTEKEFNRASKLKKRRLISIKKNNNPVPKIKTLIKRAGNELVRKRFEDTEELLRLLYGSMVDYLRGEGVINTGDFDTQRCDSATIDDISARKLKWFLGKARDERSFVLAVDTPVKEVLAHLNLLVDDQPSKGAILLFGEDPYRYVSSADINCLHYHGKVVAKPIASQQVYRGTLFEMVDASVDFVMNRLVRNVEPSSSAVASEVQYEIPFRAVREAIVNAIAHRSYSSKAGVQVMLFAETLYLTKYIERMGTGTRDMIKKCVAAGLSEPEFALTDDFVTTI